MSFRYTCERTSIDDIIALRSIKLVIYQQEIKSKGVSDNLRSLVQNRLQLAEVCYPLPFYYIEKRTILGLLPSVDWSPIICSHARLKLNYYDIYPAKQYRNLLYSKEYENVENSKILRPERDMIHSRSYFLNKLLLGTTLLPKSVVEYILEEVLK